MGPFPAMVCMIDRWVNVLRMQGMTSSMVPLARNGAHFVRPTEIDMPAQDRLLGFVVSDCWGSIDRNLEAATCWVHKMMKKAEHTTGTRYILIAQTPARSHQLALLLFR